MKELENIRRAFIDHLGKDNTAGLFHVISACTMKWLNEISFLGQTWSLCLGQYSKGAITEDHFWLEGDSKSGTIENFLDMTSDQFGEVAPFLCIGRPIEYRLETSDKDELIGILESSAVNSWIPLINDVVSKDRA